MTNKYALYVGEKIPTVSLWVRRDGKEYPIYANTRGQSEWYTFDTDAYENVEQTELSETMVEWLAHFYRVMNGLIEHEGMFPAEGIENDKPDENPVWYETEILNAINNPAMTPEQEALMKWAYNQVQIDDLINDD